MPRKKTRKRIPALTWPAWEERKALWQKVQKRKRLGLRVSEFARGVMMKRGEDAFHLPREIEFKLINRMNTVLRRALARRKIKPRRYVFEPLKTYFAEKKRHLYTMEFEEGAVAGWEVYYEPDSERVTEFFEINPGCKRRELKGAIKDFLADAKRVLKREKFLEKMEKEFGVKITHDLYIENVLVTGFNQKTGKFSLMLIDPFIRES